MTISLVNTFKAGNAASCAISGVQAGDMIVALVSNRSGSALGGAPSGYSVVNYISANATLTEGIGVFYKVAAGGETSVSGVTNGKTWNVHVYRSSAGNNLVIGDANQLIGTSTVTPQVIPALAAFRNKSSVVFIYAQTLASGTTVSNASAPTINARTSNNDIFQNDWVATWDTIGSTLTSFGATSLSQSSAFTGMFGAVEIYEDAGTALFSRSFFTAGATGYVTGVQAGDLLLAAAYRTSAATVPTLPTGWTSVQSAAANTNALLVASRVADGTETSVVFTGATQIETLVYRPGTGQTLSVGSSAIGSGTGTTATIPALTLLTSDGTSVVAGFIGSRTDTALATAPTGLTTRASLSPALGSYDTGDTGVASFTAQTKTVANTGWEAAAVEVQVTGGSGGGGGATYSLVGVTGSYTISGKAASLAYNRVSSGISGSYTISGKVAGEAYTRNLQGQSGAYTLSGLAASEIYNRKLTGNTGTYSLSGQSATEAFNRKFLGTTGSYTTSGNVGSELFNRKLTGITGAYTVSGKAATEAFNRKLLGATGLYTISGSVSSYTYSGTTNHYVLAGASGAYILSGKVATVAYNRKVTGVTGSYLTAGFAATLGFNRKLLGVTGTYTVSGLPDAYRYNRGLAGVTGVYTIGGLASVEAFNRKLLGVTGSYTLSGSTANQQRIRSLLGTTGVYSMSGKASGYLYNRRLAGTAGVYTITGSTGLLTKTGIRLKNTFALLTGA